MKINDHGNKSNNDRDFIIHKACAERWWSHLSPMQRILAHEVGKMMEQVTENKRIEIRKELERSERGSFILKKPEDGCVSAIMLPEPSPKYGISADARECEWRIAS